MASGASARDVGIRLVREGSVAESIDFLLQAIAEDPSDLEAHLCLGWAYARLEQYDKAVEILEQALDLAPTNPKVHYNLGVAYHRSHNITEAKNEYLKALSLDPMYSAAKQALDALSKMGTTDTTQNA